MSFIELDEVKRHLAVSHSHDDDVLQLHIRAAEAYAGEYLRRDLSADFPDGIPESIKAGLSMHVFALYTCRGGDAPLPPGYKIMMAHYRNFAG